MEKAPRGWIESFGKSSHSMAMQVILIDLGWWRTDHFPSHKFAYFIEQGDEDEARVLETVSGMRADGPTSNVIGVKSFATVDKGDARGLEAADFFSWHWNKWCADFLNKGKPWEARKDFKAAVELSGNSVEQIFLTGQDLEYFFSRVPKEHLEKAWNEKQTK